MVTAKLIKREPSSTYGISLYSLKYWHLGTTDCGQVYLRTASGAICLTDDKVSYTRLYPDVAPFVRELDSTESVELYNTKAEPVQDPESNSTDGLSPRTRRAQELFDKAVKCFKGGPKC